MKQTTPFTLFIHPKLLKWFLECVKNRNYTHEAIGKNPAGWEMVTFPDNALERDMATLYVKLCQLVNYEVPDNLVELLIPDPPFWTQGMKKTELFIETDQAQKKVLYYGPCDVAVITTHGRRDLSAIQKDAVPHYHLSLHYKGIRMWGDKFWFYPKTLLEQLEGIELLAVTVEDLTQDEHQHLLNQNT